MEKKLVIIVIALLVTGALVQLTLFVKDKITQETKISENNTGFAPEPSITPDPNKLTDNQSMSSNKTLSPTVNIKSKKYAAFSGEMPQSELMNKKAVITTNKGKIEFEIYPESPKAASNFIFLARDGFYNNTTFHRVVKDFVIQGGDPSGNGTGGPGYKFADELVTKPYNRGIVAMANAGPNTNGSQFFIMLADRPELPPNYTIFGFVLKGMEVVDNIEVGDVMTVVTIEKYIKPTPTPIRSEPTKEASGPAGT